MNPQATTVLERTGTFGNMPFPITLLNVPKIATATQKILMPPVRINAIDVLGKKIAGSREGKKIYPLIKQVLEEGRKVELSMKGLHPGGWFFDKAICQLYGDFNEETVDENVTVVDIRKVDSYSLRDMKEVRKLYYYDREAFDERISDIDPSLDCSKDFVADEEFVPRLDDQDYQLEEEF